MEKKRQGFKVIAMSTRPANAGTECCSPSWVGVVPFVASAAFVRGLRRFSALCCGGFAARGRLAYFGGSGLTCFMVLKSPMRGRIGTACSCAASCVTDVPRSSGASRALSRTPSRHSRASAGIERSKMCASLVSCLKAACTLRCLMPLRSSGASASTSPSQLLSMSSRRLLRSSASLRRICATKDDLEASVYGIYMPTRLAVDLPPSADAPQ